MRLRFGALALVPTLFLGVFFLWPLAALINRALHDTAGAPLGETLTRTHAWSLLGFTLGQAAASTLLTVIVAAPIIWLVARIDFAGSRLLMVIVTVPFVLPTVVVGVAFRTVFDGPLKFLGVTSGLYPILAAHIFLNVAVVVRVVAAAWQGIDGRAAEAARTLGAAPWRAFHTVTLPRLLPALAGSAALVFLFCSTSFGVIIILGNGELQTLETEIYTRAIGYFQISDAVVLSMLQIVVVLAALGLVRLCGAGGSGAADGAMAAQRAGRRRRAVGLVRVAVGAVCAWTVLWLVAPLVVLALWSVRPQAGGPWTLAGYRSLVTPINGVTPLETLGYSTFSAAVAATVALLIGMLGALVISRGGRIAGGVGNFVSTLPLGISAVTLGFGYLIVLAALPRDVRTSPLIIPAVQSLIAIPVVIRILVPALDAIPLRARQAAATLGASPVRVWTTIEMPMVGRSLGAAAGFAFVMALGEFGATGFLALPDTTTLPVLIGSALNKPGSDQVATAMACSMLLVVATTVAVLVIELVGRPSGRLAGRSAEPRR
ncbi:putative ABC transporter permease protein [Gordonia effusa NBRC 100432]|uniref:Putative ABC transporter permease protein n=1 Tax=Gordonia effusa NBRC 100432 TaxID=1077974 RepID=H0R1J7_9ACTN|nr:iron ABC transporter permease [Gordonia effusa]GAB18948.1 putative ABC transporter permease protein [Gordonia effusa NBRC 100432]